MNAFRELSREELRSLVTCKLPEHLRSQALEAYREAIVRALQRRMPSPEGVCTAHNVPVRRDDKGAYASGYWYHMYNGETCMDFQGIRLSPSSEKAQRIEAMIAKISP